MVQDMINSETIWIQLNRQTQTYSRTFYFVTFLQREKIFGRFFSFLIKGCFRSKNNTFSDIVINFFLALPWFSHVVDRSPQISNLTHSFSKNALLDFLSLALFIGYSLAKFLILYLRNSKLIPGSSTSLKFDETLSIKSGISLMKVAPLTRELFNFQ